MSRRSLLRSFGEPQTEWLYAFENNAQDAYGGVTLDDPTGVTYDTGYIGQAVDFNASGVTSYLEAPSVANFDFGAEPTDIAISFAIRVRFVAAGNCNFISRRGNTSTGNALRMFQFAIISNNIYIIFFDEQSASTGYIGQRFPFVPTLNTWYSLAATKDASATSAGIKIYVNGAVQSTTVFQGGTYVKMRSDDGTGNDILPMRIGKANYALNAINGKQDQTYIFKRELSAAEVLDIHNLI